MCDSILSTSLTLFYFPDERRTLERLGQEKLPLLHVLNYTVFALNDDIWMPCLNFQCFANKSYVSPVQLLI